MSHDDDTEFSGTMDADFGLDPHVLPQFDLLVQDGTITREFADQVIAERKAAGFPMTPGELKPRPYPLVEALRWVSEFGGPEVRSLNSVGGTIELEGDLWRWHAYGSGQFSSLSLHFGEEVSAGWYSLERIGANDQILWQNTKILARRPGENHDTDELVTVTARGEASSIQLAIAACKQWDFEPTEISGFTFHKTNTDRWEARAFDDRIEATMYSGGSDETTPWRWERNYKPFSALLEAVGTYRLTGQSRTREAALQDAISSTEKVLGIAAALLGQSDLFEIGKAAGRAELRRQILDLE